MRLLAGLLALTLCSCDAPPSGGGGDGGGGGGGGGDVACGNNRLNGFEPCDGTAFVNGPTCTAYGLGTGNVTCTAACALDFSACATTDFCTGNNAYADGNCDGSYSLVSDFPIARPL